MVDVNRDSSGLPGIGVFGTGPATTILVPHLRAAGFRIEAVWGKTLEEAERSAHQLDIPFATNRIDDVLLCKDVDLILVLSPPSLHSQITVKALGIGKHVAVESPAGISQSETLRKVKAALYYPSLISIVVYGLRFLPAFTRLRKALLEEDLIGPVSLCDVQITAPRLVRAGDTYSWACDHHMGGGVLNQFGSHVVDLLHFVGGIKAKRVHGSLRTLTKTTAKINGIRQIGADDFACFQMEAKGRLQRPSKAAAEEYDNFTTVSLNGASDAPAFTQRLLFHGEKGELLVQDGTLTHRPKDGAAEVVLCRDDVIDNNNGCGSCPRLPRIYENGVASLFCELAEKMARGGDDIASKFATFDDALYVQAVIEAVRSSSTNKAWTKVSLAQW